MKIAAEGSTLILTPKFTARFFAKFNHGDLAACWPWLARKTSSGYGLFYVGGGKAKPRHAYAHRLALMLSGVRLRDDEQACHRCDNPTCVNPSHLFAGAAKDNMQDAAAKDRISFGEHRPTSKLKAKDVPTIRRRLGGGESYHAIAADYGVSYATIGKIARGQTWVRA